MQLLDGELVLSASDLTGFSACAHLTQLELARRPRRDRAGEARRPDARRPLAPRRASTRPRCSRRSMPTADTTVVEIDYPDSTRAALEDAQEQTLEAMRKGVDVIYQATFFDGRWRGHADFLFRVETPSDLGDWSYEVADAKLARRVKAAAILQMCAYSEQLAAPPGRRTAPHPRHHRRRRAPHREALRLQRLLPRAQGALRGARARRRPTPSTYPEKVDHCGVCRWIDVCTDQRRADDHLSLVAGMRRDQTRKLVRRRRVHHHRARRARAPTAARRRHRRRVARAAPPPGRAPGHEPRDRAAARRGARARAPGSRRRPRRRRGSSAGSPRCPRRRPATSSSTWRATPTRSKAASSTCSASSSSTRTASRTTARSGRTTATRSAPRSRSSSTSRWRKFAADPEHAHLPLRALRADHAQAADGRARHARDGDRRAAARRALRRPATPSCARACASAASRTRSRRSSSSTCSGPRAR